VNHERTRVDDGYLTGEDIRPVRGDFGLGWPRQIFLAGRVDVLQRQHVRQWTTNIRLSKAYTHKTHSIQSNETCGQKRCECCTEYNKKKKKSDKINKKSDKGKQKNLTCTSSAVSTLALTDLGRCTGGMPTA
jgi:hypothetical protein